MRPEVVFITGTDTDVGKTHCAASVAAAAHHCGLRVGVYKPVASGCRRQPSGSLVPDDAVALWNAAGNPLSLQAVCPQQFEPAVAPNAAATMSGTTVDDTLLSEGLQPWITGEFDLVVVEGAGGLFSPLSDETLNIDFAERIQPSRIVVVAANRLGVIHQVMSTVTAAVRSGIAIDEVWLNQVTATADVSVETNANQLTSLINRRGLGDTQLTAEFTFKDVDSQSIDSKSIDSQHVETSIAGNIIRRWDVEGT